MDLAATRFDWRKALQALATMPMTSSSEKTRTVNLLADYIEGLERTLALRDRVIDGVSKAVKKEATRKRVVRTEILTGGDLEIRAEQCDAEWLEDLASTAAKGTVRVALRAPYGRPEIPTKSTVLDVVMPPLVCLLSRYELDGFGQGDGQDAVFDLRLRDFTRLDFGARAVFEVHGKKVSIPSATMTSTVPDKGGEEGRS